VKGSAVLSQGKDYVAVWNSKFYNTQSSSIAANIDTQG